MKYRYIILALLLMVSRVGFAEDSATVSIYLFQETQPLPEVELVIDKNLAARSDRDGAIHLALPPGQHHLNFRRAGRHLLQYDLSLTAGEDTRLFITFFTDEREPLVEVESSVTEGEQTLPAQQATAAEPGMLTGQVRSAEDGTPLAGAKLYVSGLNLEMTSGEDGTYQAELPAGEYSLSAVSSGFNTQIRDQVKIRPEQTTTIAFDLTPVGLELPEYRVLEPHVAGTMASVIEEQRTAAMVTSVLGSEQITRAGDLDAAEALRRTTGLTLVGGRFLFVRGLGERFSSTLLNDALIPSPDPTRRVVPLDLFPTTVLDSVLIQKSYSVDRPAEFAGGTVSLRTRGVPEEFFFKIATTTAYQEDTTFKKGLRYEGGSTDFLGFDDGTRELPDSMASATAGGRVIRPLTAFNPDGFTLDQIKQFGEDLSGVWDIEQKTIPPDGSLEVSLGDYFERGNFHLGYIGARRWDQRWDTINDEVRRAFSAGTGGRMSLTQDFDVLTTEQEIRTGGYGKVEAGYGDNHTLFGNLLLVRFTEDRARIQQGFTDAENEDIRRSHLRWIENDLLSHQLGGEHRFDRLAGLGLNWQYTRSEARRLSPNERVYRFDADRTGRFSFSRRADSNQVIFSDLIDNDENFQFSVNLPVTLFERIDFNLSSGYLTQSRDRDSEIRRFDYAQSGPRSRDPAILARPSLEEILVPENIGVEGFQLRETTRPTDNYIATQQLDAYFGQLDINFYDRLRLTGGLRVEDNRQQVRTFALFNPNLDPVISTLNQVDRLPALAATYSLSDKQQLRASFSETLSRPDFRELSPAPFWDPVTDTETIGNPDLEQAAIKSYDLRWEYYFSSNENLSAALYWKDIQRPIETVILPGGKLLALRNAEAATVWGIELELVKNLDFVHPSLEHFYFAGNATYTQSDIQLRPEDLLVQTNINRPLQGHSPYIFNAQLGYDNPNRGITATLLYNIVGERIIEVGTLGLPDKYEQPFHQVDFLYNHRFRDHWTFTVRIRNLLDDRLDVLQGGRITRSFRPNREFRIGFSWNF